MLYRDNLAQVIRLYGFLPKEWQTFSDALLRARVDRLHVAGG